jgi:isoleucyl-tRNA synthetase
MSKSLGNSVEPWEVINRFGADALRWYFFTSKQPWDGYRFSVETIEEAVRQFLLQLWNTYGFYVLYANANGIDRAEAAKATPSTELDRWALSRLQATVEVVRERMDEFDATNAGRALQEFVDELSNWYVRRSRRRFWDGDPAAFGTLRTCLVTVAQLLAPFCPFMADEVYESLDGAEPSVHLCDFPLPGERDVQLEDQMSMVRQTIKLGLAARAQAKVKVRQPLRAAVVVAAGREQGAIERFEALIREELNVRELRVVSAADELSEVEIKPNYRTLGPRFGKQMPLVAQAVAALDAARTAATLAQGGTVGISVGGADHQLDGDGLLVGMKPLPGYQVEREGSHAVALELAIDDELRAEGWARDMVRAIQLARQEAGLDVSDRIDLTLDGDETLIGAAREHQDSIAGETLAVRVSYETLPEATPIAIDGHALRIAVSRMSGKNGD